MKRRKREVVRNKYIRRGPSEHKHVVNINKFKAKNILEKIKQKLLTTQEKIPLTRVMLGVPTIIPFFVRQKETNIFFPVCHY